MLRNDAPGIHRSEATNDLSACAVGNIELLALARDAKRLAHLTEIKQSPIIYFEHLDVSHFQPSPVQRPLVIKLLLLVVLEREQI